MNCMNMTTHPSMSVLIILCIEIKVSKLGQFCSVRDASVHSAVYINLEYTVVARVNWLCVVIPTLLNVSQTFG